MATRVLQRRNIVVLGKTGAGKSTVANKIAGHGNFKVSSSSASETSKVSHTEVFMTDEKTNTEYIFKIIDTIGVFDTNSTMGQEMRNVSIMNEIKNHFQDKVCEGVTLVLFVFRKGRFTAEEREAFDFIIKNFSPQISAISALIITNCENEDEDGRQQVIDDFKKNAGHIARFMGKGIYAVGFPDTSKMKPVLIKPYEDLMQTDVEVLRELAMGSGEMRLGKEMFEMSFWEKLTKCVLL